MNEYAFVFPLTFIIAGIVAYIAYKKHWKIVDFI